MPVVETKPTNEPRVPENGPTHWIKAIDTVPDGEKREVFSSPANNAVLFMNPRSRTVEVVEVVVYCTTAGNFSLSVGPDAADASALTPSYPLVANQAYIDPGFLVAAGSGVFIGVSGGGAFSGHVLWRYN